ncbi:hypothetical protein BDR07DRAFT_1288508, partial [Suillus spraguei]
SSKNHLLTQVGNPKGADKKFYDPHVWVCEGKKMLSVQVKEACSDLSNVSECHIEFDHSSVIDLIMILDHL